ncbi:MAG: AsmA-like C-terminal region-containing protein [Saprospiraceae bacterium]
MWRKVKIISLTIIILFGLFLIAIPFIYRGKIDGIVKTESNKRINGKLDYSDLDISLLKSFPNLGLNINNLSLEDSSQNLLFRADRLDLSFDLKKLLFSGFTKLDLKKIELTHPVLNSFIDKSGSYNLTSLLKESSPSTSNTLNLETNLDKIIITEGQVSHIDSSSFYSISLNHLKSISTGKVNNGMLNMFLNNDLDSFSYNFNGIEYLRNIKANWTASLQLDLNSNDWVLNENKLSLNALKANIDGDITSLSGAQFFNLNIMTPQNDLKQLISILPSIWRKQFDNLQAGGSFDLNATIHGVRDGLGRSPLVNVKSTIKEGSLQYNNLPYSMKNINFDFNIKGLDSFATKYEVNIPLFNAVLNNEPFKANFKASYDNGYIANANGFLQSKIKLNELSKMLPFESTNMYGKVDIDLNFDFNENQVRKKQFDQIKFDGFITGDKIDITSKGYLPVKIDSLHAAFNPKSSAIYLSNASYGRSDASGNVNISNPVALLTAYKGLAIVDIKSTSQLLDLNEMTKSNCDTCTEVNTMNTTIPGLNISFNSQANNVKYKDYIIGATHIAGQFKSDTLLIKSLNIELNHSKMDITGKLNNPYSWTYNQSKLTGNLNISSPLFDINPYLDTATQTIENNAAYIKMMPANTNINIDFNAKRALYEKLNLVNLKSVLNIENQVLEIKQSETDFAGGKIQLNGIFSEAETLPKFDLKLDLNKIKLDDALRSTGSFIKIAPLAAFMEGLFSTSTVFQGGLNASLEPIWSKFDAAGVLELFNGKFSQFKPIEEIANKIKFPISKYLNWERSKNWFTIEKGSVIINPFIIPNKDIFIQLEGKHQIEQNINYNLILGIPKSIFDKNKINPYISTDLNWMRQELEKKGIPITSIDTFYFQINISGMINAPLTDIKWIANPGGKTFSDQLKEDIEKAVKAKADSIKESLETKIEEKKDSLIDLIQKQVDLKKGQLDSLTRVIQDSLRKIADQKSKQILDSVLRKETAKILDSTMQNKIDTLLGDKAKEEINKINEKLKNWNPLKKKKKDN